MVDDRNAGKPDPTGGDSRDGGTGRRARAATVTRPAPRPSTRRPLGPRGDGVADDPGPAADGAALDVAFVPVNPLARTVEASSDLPDDRYLNRELSWLDFNARVLALAEDDSQPLLERAKFLAIFASNLDEFLSLIHI